jgi:hypothetical protein|tara:strand:- start:3748 stop:4158 length:411 start_codon:yes stop_codon:yes gene_type:complete
MSIHSFELQKAVFSALNGGSITDASGSAITGVFDDVPTDTAYPYIRIGEETLADNSSKDKDIFEHTLTIHIWSQYRGNRDIKDIMKQVHDLLHDSSLSVSGASMVNMRQEFHTTLIEGDGITRHGVMRFRAVVSDS